MYWEYRATTTTDVPVAALCSAVFDWGTRSKDHGGLKLRKIVRESEDERVTYDHIDEPVVSSRDFALLTTRSREPGGACQIRFHAHNSEAPPSPRGFVRIEKLWGSWRFEPRADGKVQVSYTIFADAAGAVPPFLVHGTQAERARQTVRKGINLARAALQSANVAASPAK
jgi:hypothetical protein